MRNIRQASLMMVLSWLLSATAHAAEQIDLGDLIARIQFEYYAADARALKRDLDVLKHLETDEPQSLARQYYLAYGHMKLAEVLAAKDRSAAHSAAGDCVALANQVLDREPKRMSAKERARVDVFYAELWAIKFNCATSEAELSRMPGSTKLSFASVAADKARDKATELGANNPRVQLLLAIDRIRHADNNKRKAAALSKLQACVKLFDSLPPGAGDLPDWGQAEALTWLGQALLQQGDRTGARNALERALVVAQDYVWARSLLAQLKAAP